MKTLDETINGKVLRKLESELDNEEENQTLVLDCIGKTLDNYLEQFKDVLAPLHEKLVQKLYDQNMSENPTYSKVQKLVDNIETTLSFITQIGYKENEDEEQREVVENVEEDVDVPKTNEQTVEELI